MLRDLSLKGVYKSDKDNILRDFYFPTLENAVSFDRAVGFFSASTISYAAQALSAFIAKQGNIRLVVGALTSEDDLAAIQEGYRVKEISERLGDNMLEILASTQDELFKNRLETISWLVANGRLEVKIALRQAGMFHDKFGIITDADGNKIVFSGSANESVHALLPDFNYESINVFKGWLTEFDEHTKPHIDSFEELWENRSPSTLVLELPEAVKKKLYDTARSISTPPDPEVEKALVRYFVDKKGSLAGTTSVKPILPKFIDGNRFEIREHQREALRAWQSAGDGKGIFKLATGAGKTITSIYGLVQLSQSINGLIAVIAVPYQNLANQWVDILEEFNIYPIKAFYSRVNWEEQLKELVHQSITGSVVFGAIVVVNNTLKSEVFQKQLKRINSNKLVWIGDECHHHSSESYEHMLPHNARFIIGLSATPEHYLDDERNRRLEKFYGQIIYSYDLEKAISDGVLTPYKYFPHLVELTYDEANEFEALSKRIGQLIAAKDEGNHGLPENVKSLLMKRSRLVASAENKLPILKSLLAKSDKQKHSLFYCGDGETEVALSQDDSAADNLRQIDATSLLLHELGWDVSHFTSAETKKERQKILEGFKVGIIDAMIAIKCLDEGIDVPACTTAYILASSRDPRQFIQRRGRILRRAANKEEAVIHDFVVTLPLGSSKEFESGKRLITEELKRVAEFSNLSANREYSFKHLEPVLEEYDLTHVI